MIKGIVIGVLVILVWIFTWALCKAASDWRD